MMLPEEECIISIQIKKTFRLFGESHDFGKAKLENIKRCFALKQVFTGACNITDKFHFEYETEEGQIILLN